MDQLKFIKHFLKINEKNAQYNKIGNKKRKLFDICSRGKEKNVLRILHIPKTWESCKKKMPQQFLMSAVKIKILKIFFSPKETVRVDN